MLPFDGCPPEDSDDPLTLTLASSTERRIYDDPDYTDPDDPDYTPPGDSDYTPPDDSDYTNPDDPDYTNPDDPDYTNPDDPDYTNPDDPDYTNPDDPDYTDPDNPDYTPPDDPDYTNPDDPGYTDPDDPDSASPDDPDYANPDDPDYANPDDPDYTPPDDPDYANPDDPDYNNPDDPDHTNPDDPDATPPDDTGSSPTSYSLTETWFGTYSDRTDGVTEEGKTITIGGEIDGPRNSEGYLADPPDVTVMVDLDFNRAFSADEVFVITDVDALYGWFEVTVPFSDDGPSPGNGTSSDNARIRIEVADDAKDDAVTVRNVDPAFKKAPSLIINRSDSGERTATIIVAPLDPGVHDQHHVEVQWGDGTTSTGTYDCIGEPAADCERSNEITVSRTLDAEEVSAPPTLFPITVVLQDDDMGSATHMMQELHLVPNTDDDNANGNEDVHDTGFADDDLLSVRIADVVAGAQGHADETYLLAYDSSVVRIWDSRNKATPISSALPMQAIADGEFWVEGLTPGRTTISIHLHQPGAAGIHGGSVDVTVWDLDLDIDSDNNNGFNFPENSEWEEYLEDNEYGLGKLVYPDVSHYTPMRLRLPSGLHAAATNVEIRLDFAVMGRSGTIKMWNTHKADPGRDPSSSSAREGGNRLYPGETYSLSDLRYDTTSGGITLFIEATRVATLHSTKRDIEDNGKPDDRVEATLVGVLDDSLSDEVKYMVVEKNSFYPQLQSRRELRNAMASQGVYGISDLPQFGLRHLTDEDLRDLQVPDEIIELIGEPAGIAGFKNAIYWDHISGNYVLAFAGTDDVSDVIEDIWQGLGWESEQYPVAMRIAVELQDVDFLRNQLIATGHSLGGGLASAASVVAGIPADTFNAAGLLRETLLERDQNGDVIPDREIYPGSLARYDNAPALINAYFLDWDLLSWVQDNTPLQDAIGKRIEMDGPADLRLTIDAAWLTAQLLSGVGWATIAATLGDAAITMGKAHTTEYYHYGLMVYEDAWGVIVWDIYGYDFY